MSSRYRKSMVDPSSASASTSASSSSTSTSSTPSSLSSSDPTGLRSQLRRNAVSSSDVPSSSPAAPSISADLSSFLSNPKAIAAALGLGAVAFSLLYLFLTSPSSSRSRRRQPRIQTDGQNGDSPSTPRTPVGMRNVGNSCYMNALLQTLQSNQPFMTYLSHLQQFTSRFAQYPMPFVNTLTLPPNPQQNIPMSTSYYLTNANRFLTTLHRLLVNASSSNSNQPLDPEKFFELFVSASGPKFAGRNQQDAHELFHVLIDIMDTHAELIKQVMSELKEKYFIDEENMFGVVKQEAAPATEAVAQKDNEEKEEAISDTKAEDSSTADTDKEDSPSNLSPVSSSTSLHQSGELDASAAATLSASASTSPIATAASPSSSSASPPTSCLHVSDLTNPFSGFESHFLMCTSCHSFSSSSRISTFTSLTLSFDRNASSLSRSQSSSNTLDDMLQHEFNRTERVDSVKCEQCRWTQRRVTLQLLLTTAHDLPTKGPKSLRQKNTLLEVLKEAYELTLAKLKELEPQSGAWRRRQREIEMEAQWKASFGNGTATASSATANSNDQVRGDPSASPIADSATPPLSDSESDSHHFLASSNSSIDSNRSSRASSQASSTSTSAMSKSSSSTSLSNSTPQLDPASLYFDALKVQLKDSAFTDTIPAGFVSKLQDLCAIEVRRSFLKGCTISSAPKPSQDASSSSSSSSPASSSPHSLLPPSLMIQLNRLGAQSKVTQLVEFPLLLDLKPYLANGNTHDEIDPSTFYELDGVVVHQGGGHGGHYIAYRRQVQHFNNHPISSVATEKANETTTQQPAQVPDAKNAGGEEKTSQTEATTPSPQSLFALAPEQSQHLSSSSSHTSTATWWYASDERTYQVEVEEVLRAQAYLLVYSQVRK